MLTRERMLEVYKKSIKSFKEDPYKEKLGVSNKQDDVEVYSKQYTRDDYENNSISFDRVYSDIEHLRKKHEIQLS